jgi:hypothetical protein
MNKIISIQIVAIFVLGSLIPVIALQNDSVAAEEWNIQEVVSEDQKGQWNSIAVDSANIPHISYNQGWGDHNIYYAKLVGNEWVEEIVDISGLGSSIAIDSDDLPHISYNRLWIVLVMWVCMRPLNLMQMITPILHTWKL